MAHNLYKNVMAYAGEEVPWHKLGVQFTEPMTAAQAIEAAHLGYVVEKRPLFVIGSDGNPKAIDRVATVNTDNDEVLGVVSPSYEVVQNLDCFAFFDILLAESGAFYETAGAIGNGERMFLLARMPEQIVALPGDVTRPYILLSNTHDGSGALEARFTGIRVVCQNTLDMAIRGSKATVSIRHTVSAPQRLQVAAMILNDYRRHLARMGETIQELAEFKVDDEFIEEYTMALFGDPSKQPEGRGRTIALNKIQMFEGRLRNGKGVDLPGVAGTAWWAWNAAVEFADYDLCFRTDRTKAILYGGGREFKQEALDKALVLVRR